MKLTWPNAVAQLKKTSRIAALIFTFVVTLHDALDRSQA